MLPCQYYHFIKNLKYPPPTNSLDAEIIPFVALLNTLPFFDSTGSCAGHGDRVWVNGVVTDEPRWLGFIAEVETCYGESYPGYYLWFKKGFQDWKGCYGERNLEIESPPLYSYWEITFYGNISKAIAFLRPTIEKITNIKINERG